MKADMPVAFSKTIRTNIRIAWVAGLTSAFSILVFLHFSTNKFHEQYQHTALLLSDALLTALLAYGVYRFSRIAAILLPVLFITNEIVIWRRIR